MLRRKNYTVTVTFEVEDIQDIPSVEGLSVYLSWLSKQDADSRPTAYRVTGVEAPS